MPSQLVLDGECWIPASAVAVGAIGWPPENMGGSLTKRALWARRKLFVCVIALQGCPRDALAWWYMMHYAGVVSIGMTDPLFVIEFPQQGREN